MGGASGSYLSVLEFVHHSDCAWLGQATAKLIRAQDPGRLIRLEVIHARARRVHARARSTCTNTHRACSAVVIALRFGTQGPGFEPGLSHKACYMPLHG